MNKVTFFFSALFIVNSGFSQITSPSPYCDASFDDMQGFPVDDHISSVTFGTLSNASNAQYAAPHYVFYNNLAAPNFTIGTAHNLDIVFEVAGGCGYGVWIDYNHNNIFDASEKVGGTSGTDYLAMGSAPVSNTITIPMSATLGNTRMRIRIVEDDNHNMTSTEELPCNLSTSDTDVMDWGETEDYTINITGTAGISESSQNNTISIYPNPSNGMITVINEKSANSDVEIYNLVGELVFKTAMNHQKTIDLSNQPKGVYMVKMTGENESIIKEKIVLY